ncbi:hypothetical protein IL306_009851 [Fusarium sp. DS 682]|nr:hypothetical protein IL306_009851 [Fusarium sp. DS 682]
MLHNNLFIFLIATCNSVIAVASTNETSLVEQLFLDVSVHDVVHQTEGIPTLEPWSSEYVAAIRERRFGNAVWARYHMMGGVTNGMVDDTNLTVLESIKEDAVGYKTYYADDYADAMALYASTADNDTNTKLLTALSETRASKVSQLEERSPTFGISCSADYLAVREDCVNVLDRMSESRAYVGGNRRAIYGWGTCHLRVGPLTRKQDVTYYTVHSVARLIEEHCARSCCGGDIRVSGASPKNRSHRKICLSRKRVGCS